VQKVIINNRKADNANTPGVNFRQNLILYLMIAPFLIMFFTFLVLPILTSIVLSFFDYDMVKLLKWAGLGNYFKLFLVEEEFPIVVRNTVIFALVTGPLGFSLSFVLAWFINEFRPVVRTCLSFLFYAPALVGNAYFIWQMAFSGDSYGYINNLLLSAGLITEPIAWLKNAKYVLPIVMIVQLWQSMGVSFLANISGLQNINQELYESGAIDGIRNRWQELWYITLPSMKHMLLFSAVMQIQTSFSVGAISTELAGYPSVNNAADTIVAYMVDVGTVRFEMGYASAIAVFLFVMMLLVRALIDKLINMVGR